MKNKLRAWATAHPDKAKRVARVLSVLQRVFSVLTVGCFILLLLCFVFYSCRHRNDVDQARILSASADELPQNDAYARNAFAFFGFEQFFTIAKPSYSLPSLSYTLFPTSGMDSGSSVTASYDFRGSYTSYYSSYGSPYSGQVRDNLIVYHEPLGWSSESVPGIAVNADGTPYSAVYTSSSTNVATASIAAGYSGVPYSCILSSSSSMASVITGQLRISGLPDIATAPYLCRLRVFVGLLSDMGGDISRLSAPARSTVYADSTYLDLGDLVFQFGDYTSAYSDPILLSDFWTSASSALISRGFTLQDLLPGPSYSAGYAVPLILRYYSDSYVYSDGSAFPGSTQQDPFGDFVFPESPDSPVQPEDPSTPSVILPQGNSPITDYSTVSGYVAEPGSPLYVAYENWFSAMPANQKWYNFPLYGMGDGISASPTLSVFDMGYTMTQIMIAAGNNIPANSLYIRFIDDSGGGSWLAFTAVKESSGNVRIDVSTNGDGTTPPVSLSVPLATLQAIDLMNYLSPSNVTASNVAYATYFRQLLLDVLRWNSYSGTYGDGYQAGYDTGFGAGESYGRDQGYQEGYQAGLADSTSTAQFNFSFLLNTVDSFLNYKFLGVFSLGQMLGVLVFGFVALMLLKIFAGG